MPETITLIPGPRFIVPRADAAGAVWFVQSVDGEEWGPWNQHELDEAAAARLIDGNALVWREGWSDSKLAGELYEELIPVHYMAPPAAPRRFIAGAEVHAYQRRDPQGQGRVWQTSLPIMLAVMFVLLCLLELVMGTLASGRFALCFLSAAIGIPLLAMAVRESNWLFNSHVGAWVRARTGDAGLYFGLVALSAAMVVISFITMFGTTLSALIHY